jgi:hypothetical protein
MSNDDLTINIVNVIGDSYCISADDGDKVYEKIIMGFENNRKVVLSFLNVEMLTTAFLNTSIGRLYGRYSEERVKANLEVRDIAADDKVSLKRVVDTAKLYYQDGKGALEESIRKIMEE